MTSVARALVTAGAVLSFGMAGPVLASDTQAGGQVAQATNPCAAKNPCAAAGKVDPELITRPAGPSSWRDACRPDQGRRALWNDKKRSNGLACQTCHQGNAAFQPFPQAFLHRCRRRRG